MIQMKKVLFYSIISLALSGQMSAQDRQLYIEQFSAIAISEMHRTGIPASIKLAQGILESNAGASSLAIKANNHFGIKCGNAWRGKKMYRKDDDRNRKGQLVKSCFREFDSAEASYIAHSEFLKDPNKHYRYGSLFKLSRKNYKGWAHGLKKAGYATNPRYPQLLIKIIEQYQLYQFDEEIPQYQADEEIIVDQRPADKFVPPPPSRGVRIVEYENKAKYTVSIVGDTPIALAKAMGVSPGQIIKYNEEIQRRGEQLIPGERIFLENKKGKFKGVQRYHITKPGERLIDISNHYGVKVKSLRKRNGLDKNDEPASGQKIYLQGKNPRRVKTIGETSQRSSTAFLWKESETPQGPAPRPTRPTVQTDQAVFPNQGETDFVEYTVKPKDTLYAIARQHGTSVDILKKLNNLDAPTIHPGQLLRIK